MIGLSRWWIAFTDNTGSARIFDADGQKMILVHEGQEPCEVALAFACQIDRGGEVGRVMTHPATHERKAVEAACGFRNGHQL